MSQDQKAGVAITSSVIANQAPLECHQPSRKRDSYAPCVPLAGQSLTPALQSRPSLEEKDSEAKLRFF